MNADLRNVPVALGRGHTTETAPVNERCNHAPCHHSPSFAHTPTVEATRYLLIDFTHSPCQRLSFIAQRKNSTILHPYMAQIRLAVNNVSIHLNKTRAKFNTSCTFPNLFCHRWFAGCCHNLAYVIHGNSNEPVKWSSVARKEGAVLLESFCFYHCGPDKVNKTTREKEHVSP